MVFNFLSIKKKEKKFDLTFFVDVNGILYWPIHINSNRLQQHGNITSLLFVIFGQLFSTDF